MQKVNILEEGKKIKKPFVPRHIEDVGDYNIYLVLLEGEYKRHKHPYDEFFYVVDGEIAVELGNSTEKLKKGEGLLVRKGTWHKSRSAKKSLVMMFERAGFDAQYEK
jgi:mannose-6-phosphate isomerase-like protein (cupin superfamily)